MFAKLAKRAWRRDYDQGLIFVGESARLQHLRGLGGEAVLLLLVEIDLVHRAAERVRGMTRKVAGLFPMRRIVVDLLLLDDQIRKCAVALVAEEERLPAVGDED